MSMLPRRLPLLALLIPLLLFNGCDSSPPESEVAGPQVLTRANDCHLCGMVVFDQQGPKGQVRRIGNSNIAHFCSTSDLMAFLFQPENRATIRQAWVHNMHQADWRSPPNRSHAYIDAYTAWYVVDHNLLGAMGHTLAPFASEEQANTFIAQHGGHILRFEEISVDLIAEMASYAFPDFSVVRDFDPEVELGGRGERRDLER